MDTADKVTAKKVLRANYQGIGFSSTGVDGTYTIAWTIDGHFNADFITTGTIKSIEIDAGNGAFHVDSSGALTATNANISGTITSSTISGSKLLFTINGSTCATAETGTIKIPSWTKSITITGLEFTGSTLFDVNNFGVNTNECIFRSGNATLEMTPGELQILTWGTGNAANSLTMASDYSDFGCNNGRTIVYATTNLELSGENIIMRNNVSNAGGISRTIYFDSGYVRYN